MDSGLSGLSMAPAVQHAALAENFVHEDAITHHHPEVDVTAWERTPTQVVALKDSAPLIENLLTGSGQAGKVGGHAHRHVAMDEGRG